MAVGLSSIMVAMMLGAIVFGLPGGAFADRLGAGRALVFGAAGRAIVMTAALAISGRPELAAVVAFAYSAVSQLYSPSELALVSALAPRRPAGAHSLLVALQHTGQGAGIIVLAPAAFFIGGAEAMVATGMALYVGVTILATLLAQASSVARTIQPARRTYDFTGTLRYLTRRPEALYAGSALAFSEMAAKAIVIAIPLYLAQDLHLEALEPAAIVIPAAIGAVGGLLWAARGLELPIAPGTMRLTLAGTVVAAVALAGLGNGVALATGLVEVGPFGWIQDSTDVSVAVAVPVALLLGACFIIAPIAARTVLSATAPITEQGRVFATQAMMTDIIAILPLILAGVGAEMAGARATFLVVAALGAALFLALEVARLRSGPIHLHAPIERSPMTGA